jgi:hypothetical protein
LPQAKSNQILSNIETCTELNRGIQILMAKSESGEDIIIYDLLITIAYFSVAFVLSVAMTLFEKTKPIY